MGQPFGGCPSPISRTTSASTTPLTSTDAHEGTVDFTYDKAGNREIVLGGDNPGGYVLSGSEPPEDLQMNQYTSAPGPGALAYDDNGNLVATDTGNGTTEAFVYDYRNLMTQYTKTVAGTPPVQVVTSYAYDMLGRRYQKVYDVGSRDDEVRTTYIHSGSQVLKEIREQNNADPVEITYVYGGSIDDLVMAHWKQGTFEQDWYYLTDPLGNVMAVVEADGTILERYDYGPFGEPYFFNAGWTVEYSESQIGNTRLFNGQPYDAESGLYYYRTRYLSPGLGRFTTRDSIGLWGDPANL